MQEQPPTPKMDRIKILADQDEEAKVKKRYIDLVDFYNIYKWQKRATPS